jgi:hypothetical protein
MNDTVRIEGRPLCQRCAEADLKTPGGDAPDLSVLEKQWDPTVCWGCSADFGSVELVKLGGGLPVCEPCRQAFQHRPYPNWVKFSFAALVAIAILSLVVNWRFTMAYREMRQASRAMEARRVEAAAALMASSSARVPESTDLKDAAGFYRGLWLMTADKSAEALPLLRAYAAKYPGDAAAELVLGAEMGAAFDAHDYDAFLAKAQEWAQRQKDNPIGVAGLASAYACKYAATQDESFRAQALELLHKAKASAGAQAAEIQEYEERTLYRLETRQIISPAEYKKRFPNGRKGGSH